MATFQTLTDLPPTDQVEIARIQAITATLRNATEVAFLAARQATIDNEILLEDDNGLILEAAGDTTPDGFEGFRKGCFFFVFTSTNRDFYINVGSTTNAIWSLITRAVVGSSSASASASSSASMSPSSSVSSSPSASLSPSGSLSPSASASSSVSASASPSSNAVLDQYQTSEGVNFGFGIFADPEVRYRGQCFTPSVTGSLQRLGFSRNKNLNPVLAKGMRVYIDTTTGHLPTNPISSPLYYFDIPVDTVVDEYAEYTLPVPVLLSAGVEYCFYVAPWDVGGSGTYIDDYEDFRGVAGGNGMKNVNGTWIAESRTIHFATYMIIGSSSVSASGSSSSSKSLSPSASGSASSSASASASSSASGSASASSSVSASASASASKSLSPSASGSASSSASLSPSGSLSPSASASASSSASLSPSGSLSPSASASASASKSLSPSASTSASLSPSASTSASASASLSPSASSSPSASLSPSASASASPS